MGYAEVIMVMVDQTLTLVNQSSEPSRLGQPETDGREAALAALNAFIASGNYSPGDRLPPERELTGFLSITRTRLRWCLEALEREGRIWRHVGKGTFLAAEGSDSLTDLGRRTTPVQLMRARATLEPALAREAALNASGEALEQISLARSRAEEAVSWDEYETHDDRFHRAVAEATGNVLLLSLFDRLNRVRRLVAWSAVVRDTVRPPSDHSSFAEHARIAAGIAARNPAAAHAAMQDHLGSVAARLFGDG